MSELSVTDIQFRRDDHPSDNESTKLYKNFLGFCALFSIAHATVDAILAFSAAELGTGLGSASGFALYLFYTLSALFVAKPFLKLFGSKQSIFFGLSGLFCYVLSFFLAVEQPSTKYPVFLTGAVVGGIGAGILWPAQSSYFEANAAKYSEALNESKTKNVVMFAAIFVVFYLSCETAFKIVATLIFLGADGQNSWQALVFGFYAAAAFISIFFFYVLILNFDAASRNIADDSDVSSQFQNVVGAGGGTRDNSTTNNDVNNGRNLTDRRGLLQPLQQESSSFFCSSLRSLSREDLFGEVLAVGRATCTSRLLQYIIPFQFCFGISAGFVNTYVMGVIVNSYQGDGYIGLLSGLSTLSAVSLAKPFVYLANNYPQGKWMIMMFGAVCFAWAGLPLLFLSDASIAQWGFMVPYFLIHGAARGVWENTNKAVVAEYFSDDEGARNVAFAAVYVFSGFSGALGYLLFNFMPRIPLALLNVAVPCVAAVFYHLGFAKHRALQGSQRAVTASINDIDDCFETSGAAAETGSVNNSNSSNSLYRGIFTKVVYNNLNNQEI